MAETTPRADGESTPSDGGPGASWAWLWPRLVALWAWLKPRLVGLAVEAARRARPFAPVALALAVVVGWVFRPLWPVFETELLGDPASDAIRGMWSVDHLGRSLIPPATPWSSTLLNFPEGYTGILLPMVSGLLLSPIGWVFGPLKGWSLAVVALVWLSGLFMAVFVHGLTGSRIAGFVAGSTVATQPLVLYAVCDGTAEHLALWPLCAYLALVVAAARAEDRRVALVAGAFVGIVALDSPYHGIYAVILSALLVPHELVKGRGRALRQLLILAVVAGVVSGALHAVLGTLGTGAVFDPNSEPEQVRNATDLHIWHDIETGQLTMRHKGWRPMAIPGVLVLGLAIFSLPGGLQAVPWIAGGLFMVALSFGLRDTLATELGGLFGAPGEWVGRGIETMNAVLYQVPGISDVRFPLRWLVPAILAFSTGASLGLGRMFNGIREGSSRFVALAAAALLAFGAADANIRTCAFYSPFPAHQLPEVQFATWIGEQSGSGAVIVLPHSRPYVPGTHRDELPVLANLGSVLSSADELYFQVIHRRPMLACPQFQTIALAQQNDFVRNLVRGWDDLARPSLSGMPAPQSALETRPDIHRQEALRYLVEEGLRWLVLDLGVYTPEMVTVLQRQLGSYLVDARYFDEGDGVLVLVLQGTE